MFRTIVLILILLASVIHCQFLYNYEEDVPEDFSQSEPRYDMNQNQQLQQTSPNEPYSQPSQPTDNPPRSRSARTQVRIRSNNYPPLMDGVNSDDPSPEVDARTLRQERRQEKRRQRQRMSDYNVQPYQPPRVYGPSVFERIGLGEAPAGVFVPQDSFLNVLRNTGSSFQPPVPQARSFVQPAVSYVDEPQQSFFVQPPANMDNSRTSLMVPVSSHQAAAPTPSRPQLQGRSVDSGRRSRPQRRRTQPVVDIDSYREHTDDIGREEIQIVPKVEYITATENRDIIPTQKSRIVPVEPPRSPIDSRSVFENVPLGEAPSGVYVPEDSLLNAIRNPSAQRSTATRNRQYIPPQTYYHSPEEAVIDSEPVEEEYQAPPPVRSTARRQSSTRSKPSQRQSYSVPQENAPVQQRQRSSQRQRNDYADDLQRRPRQEQPRRRQQSAAGTTRSQSQASSSQARPFREAKLALAELPMDSDDDGIPGEAGTDYPTLHVIPKTAFSCSQQPHNGYYADLETSCQVVHMCQAGGVKSSYLCPNGTIFNQEKFSCQWWYEVNCSDAPNYYIKNNELYKIPEREDRKRN